MCNVKGAAQTDEPSAPQSVFKHLSANCFGFLVRNFAIFVYFHRCHQLLLLYWAFLGNM